MHRDVSLVSLAKRASPQFENSVQIFAFHLPMMDQQDQVTLTIWPASKKKVLAILKSFARSLSPFFPALLARMARLQDPCLRIYISPSLYLRILCKIHISGSMCPIHVLASVYLRVLCKTHVSDSYLYIRFCGSAQSEQKFVFWRCVLCSPAQENSRDGSVALVISPPTSNFWRFRLGLRPKSWTLVTVHLTRQTT